MKRKANKGFTLAEMLIVVAIIIVLTAVAFIAVYNYQRSMYQLEFDGIAREIYFAAQNHLTQADSQGLVEQRTDEQAGTKAEDYYNQGETAPTEGKTGIGDVFYYAVPTDTSSGNDILSLMLPSMSIDTNSSLGVGSFFILYQKSTATVLDVFYSVKDNSRFAHNYVHNDYTELLGLRGDAKKEARRNVNGAVYGYYGGENAQSERLTIKAPELKVENAEKLKVILTNTNETSGENSILDKLTIQLIITGKTSTAEKTITVLKDNSMDGASNFDPANPDGGFKDFEIYLDDITKDGGHFSQRFKDADANSNYFIPGEDLEIRAKIFSADAYANIAWSASATTNSLFADPYTGSNNPVLGSDVTNGTAAIANFRHFENLDAKVSNLDLNDTDDDLTITKAAQTTDMDWNKFLEKTSATKIYPISGSPTEDKCAYPVVPQTYDNSSYAAINLSYDGQRHSVSNVKANYSGDAGLFSKLTADSKVENLELIDFDITGTSSAGALVGTATGAAITNVVAHHTEKTEAYKTPTVNATGDAGGLIGKADNCTVNKSAAALVVNGGANAGGLIGSATGSTVTQCYAGGHTIDVGTEAPKKVLYDSTNYNVVGGTTAGGLIGSTGTTTVTNSYSTCSAQATGASGIAGGFLGTGSGKVTGCYCTGLVSGDANNAFLGSGTLASGSTNNLFFELVNEVVVKEGDKVREIKYKEPGDDSVTAFDASAATYESFVGGESAWDPAQPYDHTLIEYYGGNYNLRTVLQLPATATKEKHTSSTDFVATHYGDWPAPETFVVNN